jgi:hypothetical protein
MSDAFAIPSPTTREEQYETEAAVNGKPKPPELATWKHPIKFTRQRVGIVLSSALFTYIGVLAIAGLYYLLFEVWHPATNLWHEAVPNGELRHNVRDVAEGLLGGLFALMIKHNHFKKKTYKKPNLLDRIEMALHIPNLKDNRRLSGGELVAIVPIVLLYAVPGFFLGEELVHIFHHLAPSVRELAGYEPTVHYSGLLDKVKGDFTESWPKKLIGVVAAFIFGHRPAQAAFDDIQLFFAERRVVKHKPLRWYHPPAFKARYNVVTHDGCLVEPTKVQSVMMVGGVLVVGALAAFGFYVLNYIAK